MASLVAAAASKSTKPDVIWILVDDFGYVAHPKREAKGKVNVITVLN